MAGSTSKKIIVRRFDREPLQGIVNPQTYLQAGGVEMLTPSGSLSRVPYADVKAVYFVRDFDSPETEGDRRLFTTRPKVNGLWVRLHFRDGELMDGVLPNDLLHLDPHGFLIVPPNASSSNTRIFVPRAALQEFHVLGVIGSPLRSQRAKAKPKEQIGLFDGES